MEIFKGLSRSKDGEDDEDKEDSEDKEDREQNTVEIHSISLY